MKVVHIVGSAREVRAPELGMRHLGIPPGGPADTDAFDLATLLCSADVAWECIGEVTFETLAGSVSIVNPDSARRVPVPSGQFVVAPSRVGLRTYVAFTTNELPSLVLADNWSKPATSIRVTPGPQFDPQNFPVPSSFSFGLNLDRIGLQADPIPAWYHSQELPSEPCIHGAIQVTRNGTPIIFGPDGPTIGGYPKPFVVISADRARLGQIKPLQSTSIECVTLEQAHQIANIKNVERLRQRAELHIALCQ